MSAQEKQLLTDERLTKIRNVASDAQFGYTSITPHLYYKDVTSLLEERDLLLQKILELSSKLEQAGAELLHAGTMLRETLRNTAIATAKACIEVCEKVRASPRIHELDSEAAECASLIKKEILDDIVAPAAPGVG